jgi:ABC-type sugar transport system substrate-binding protein
MTVFKSLRRGVAPVAIIASIMVAACGSSTATQAPATAAPATAAPATAAPAKTYTIGVSYPTSNSPFWQAYLAFVNDGAKQLGITINAVSADTNEQKQVADIQNLISQGVDGLIITPQSTAVAPQLLKMIQDAKIKVVVVDRYPGYDPGTNKDADYVAFLGPNDVQAGKGIAEALIAAGGDKILALGGLNGSSVAEGRKQGLDEGIAAKSGTLVQYVAAGETQELGLTNAESMLQAHTAGTANSFWCYNDNLCIGAIKAAKNAGRSGEFKFGGMDLTPDAIAAITDGSYTVSFGGHWLQGGFGLIALYDALNGKAPKTALVKLNLLQVDSSNVAKFKAQYIDNPPTYDFKQLSQVFNAAATGSFEITLK